MRMINDDGAGSTSREHFEKDVMVLNRNFDDIERFTARLQHVAAARRELERRRKYVNKSNYNYILELLITISVKIERSRKNKKKKEQEDGMLAMLVCPPSDPEYIDIFQKFKLSFNLLVNIVIYFANDIIVLTVILKKLIAALILIRNKLTNRVTSYITFKKWPFHLFAFYLLK